MDHKRIQNSWLKKEINFQILRKYQVVGYETSKSSLQRKYQNAGYKNQIPIS